MATQIHHKSTLSLIAQGIDAQIYLSQGRNMPLFTAENAATIAKRRWEICPTHTKQPSTDDPAKTEQTPQQAELARTREHIDLINQQLDDCKDPDEWDCLTRSKERLFRIWARLAQLPMDPKATPARTRSTPQPVAYSLPTIAPQADTPKT